MDRTTTTLVRHILRDDTVNPLIAEGVKYTVWFARRVWYRTDLLRARAADATEEGIAAWRMRYHKDQVRSLFASYISYEDLEGELLCTLVKVANRFTEKPAEQQEHFIAYLRRGLINDIRQLYRWAQRHDSEYVTSLDAQKYDQEDSGTYDTGNVDDLNELDLEVADTDPLKKRTDDVSKHVDEEVYAFEFLRTLTDRQRFVIELQMEDLTLSDRAIGEQVKKRFGIGSQATVFREKKAIALQLMKFDPERMPQWLAFLR